MEQVTGIHIDHFIQLEFTGVVKVVDDVGGVNVCVPQNISDKNSGLDITAGEHHINGLTFLEFWRARYSIADGGDLKRINRDDLLLAEMLRGIISTGLLSSPTRLLPVVDDAAKAIYATDSGLTQTDMLHIAESFRGLSSSNVQFIEAVTQPYPPAPAQVELVQPGDGQLFSAIAHDVALPKKPRAKAGTAGPTVAAADVKVMVLNGTTVPRLAADTGATLAARGFQLMGTGNGAQSSGSVVEYPSAAELPAARTLAAQVAGATLRRDRAVAGRHRRAHPRGQLHLAGAAGRHHADRHARAGHPAVRVAQRLRVAERVPLGGQPGQDLRRHQRRRQLPDRRGRLRALGRVGQVRFDPGQCGGEAGGGSVAADELVGAHRDAAPLLEPVEAALDDVAALVAFLLRPEP